MPPPTTTSAATHGQSPPPPLLRDDDRLRPAVRGLDLDPDFPRAWAISISLFESAKVSVVRIAERFRGVGMKVNGVRSGVETALENDNQRPLPVAFDPVKQAMLLGDPPRPQTL